MNYSTHKITLDVAGFGVQSAITLRRGESAHRLEVTFTDGGKPYTIAADCTAMFAAAKPDSTQILNTCTISENTVTAEITPQTTAAVGRVDCEMRLYGLGNLLLIAPRFCIFVEDTAIDENGVESSDEYSALDELIGRAQNTISAGLITAAEATVDASSGTPAVAVTQQNITGGKKLVFAFTGLKGSTGAQGAKGDTGDKGDTGEKGDTGSSGVYVGSGSIPAGYNVQIDPSGSADSLITSTEFEPVAALGAITAKKLGYLTKLTKGQIWDTANGATPAYRQAVPTVAKAIAVNKIGGKTVFFNQLVQNGNFAETGKWVGTPDSTKAEISISTGTNECTVISRGTGTGAYIGISTDPEYSAANIIGHKYFVSADVKPTMSCNFFIGLTNVNKNGDRYTSPTLSADVYTTISGIVTKTNETSGYGVYNGVLLPNGQGYTIKNVMAIDLTAMFGAGNEPATVDAVRQIFPADYYAYSTGTLISADVASVDSVDEDNVPLGSLTIPAAVRALEGYGESNGADYNYIDLEAKKYYEVGHYVNGVWTAHVQEIDISAYLSDDNLLTVEERGTVTFTQSGVHLPIPNETAMYAVKELAAGDITYDGTETYASGTVGAELTAQKGDIAQLDADKLDISQGVAHAGDFVVVGSDGNITTMTMQVWQGGSY